MIFFVVHNLTLDMVLVRFLVIKYHIPSMTCKVMKQYKGEHQSSILVHEFEHMTGKGGCGERFFISAGYHGSNVKLNSPDGDNPKRYMKPFISLKVTALCNILNNPAIHSTSHLISIVVYYHHPLTAHVKKWICIKHNKYCSSGWRFSLATVTWQPCYIIS